MIKLMVAYANGRVIGKDGKMPWHLPNDLKYVKNTTTGHTVVMGRKTFESIGRPLPNRRNVVLTRNEHFDAPGVEVVHSKSDVLALGDVFILGGANVYAQFLDEADRLYITEIDLDVEGDTFFPDWNREAFTLVSKEEGTLDEKNTIPHTFYVYERKR
ncbi:MAG: dihydrofolate reductase [Novibacillus thermophilus]|jgi:dihydrofolate reductase|uniref:Dihydrofolate reductase n=1 Tax=Novibacillus thermophilus TaxID=1471761 RepID=A0A1U9K3M8_9BACL|nr:dihydrofolate reductase [Novibacillus thermophilus]AQS54636.1 dihydrofolate reductase [Novibacillus thermophilus]